MRTTDHAASLLRRLFSAAAILLLFAVAVPMAAPGIANAGNAKANTGPEANAGAIADANAYRLMPGDRITVTVFGDEQLSGTFSIDMSGAINMPVAGRIELANKTLEQSRKTIMEMLGQQILKNPVVNVRVDEYRPIYVYGHVKDPGVYPFRTGMTAVGAMVVAGGTPTLATNALMAASELNTAEERVRVLQARILKLSIRVAGLEAQRDGRETVDATDLPASVRDADLVDAFLEAERKRLTIEIASSRAEIEMLENQRPHFEKEQAYLDDEIAAQTKLLDLNTERLDQMRKLEDRGFSRGGAVMELAQQQAIIESSVSRLKSAKSRSELERAAVELKAVEKLNLFKERVLLALDKTSEELKASNIQLLYAKQALEMRRQAAGIEAGPAPLSKYVIYRTINGKQEAIETNGSASVEPGDIIEVKSPGPTRSGDAGGLIGIDNQRIQKAAVDTGEATPRFHEPVSNEKSDFPRMAAENQYRQPARPSSAVTLAVTLAMALDPQPTLDSTHARRMPAAH